MIKHQIQYFHNFKCADIYSCLIPVLVYVCTDQVRWAEAFKKHVKKLRNKCRVVFGRLSARQCTSTPAV